MKDLSTTKILGVNVSTEKRSDILKNIIKRLKSSHEKFYIVTPNPELIMIALRDKGYKDILNHAQISLPDGVGVLAASKLLKSGISDRITGVDFMQELVAKCAKEGLTTGFFGGRAGVAEETSNCLKQKYPNLKVVYTGDEWESAKLKGRTIDVLFVALGSPKQEKWIAENLDKIPVKCAMGVGGAFDFISGRVKRAPKTVRLLGLEWAFRLINEPWRIKRQSVLPIFAFYIIRERLLGNKSY